jgi:putative addiction module component (TIGR02574 family)
MSAPLKVPLEFDQLPVEQRVAYVQALWDQIAAHPENVPVPLEHQQVLLERIATYTAGAASSGRPWSEVRDQLLAELGRS